MILVDASAWIDFFQGKKLAPLVDSLLEANQVAICGPILTELYRGFRSEKEKNRVMALFAGCYILSQPDNLWEDAGDIGLLLQGKKRQIKTLDLLIACYALYHRTSLLTLDSDFQRICDVGLPLILVSARE